MEQELKSVLDSVRASVESVVASTKAQQVQLDAIDQAGSTRFGNGPVTKSIAQEVFEHEDFKQLGENGGRGRCVVKVADFRQKSLTNTAAGISTSGVLTVDRLPGIVGPMFRQLRIRDLLRSQPTTEAACDYVKVTDGGFLNAASPQVEASMKAQSDLTLTAVQAPVRTLAHWIPASKQIFSDLPGLSDLINSTLMYGLKLLEEKELLSGDGTQSHLLGLIPQATAFQTSLLPGQSNRLDVIATAIRQSERTDYAVDAIVLNTDDFWALALTKNTIGDYLFGSPSAANIPSIWGRPIAVTNSISSGNFLVGSSSTALIRDRMEAVVEISDSHANMFIENMLAIRCEERLTLQVMRPAAWIYGAFPA